MRNFSLRNFLSAVASLSLLTAATVNAAPVRFNQVVQIVNAKPGKANTGNFSQLRLANDPVLTGDGENDPPNDPPAQDDRVITETRYDIVEEEVCDCLDPIPPKGGGFPYWTLLGLAAIPFFFIGDDDKTPTRTPPTTGTPTETPTITPTPTTTPTVSPTPSKTPTPPPEPVPEPMTILLFGTGLAGIGLAARRKFGKKDEVTQDEE